MDDGSEQGLDHPDIVTVGIKRLVHMGTKTADFVTAERQSGVAVPADGNLDEDHVSPTMSNADTCHDPRTGVWGRIGDGSKNSLGNICGEQGHASYPRQPVHIRLGPKVLS